MTDDPNGKIKVRKDLPSPPQPDWRDAAHKVGKIASTVASDAISKGLESPIGVPIGEFYEMILRPPIDRKRDEFLEMVRSKILELFAEVDAINSPEFWHNPVFTNALLNAIPAAIRTDQREKLEALRNCVVNSMIVEVDTDVRSSLYTLLDRLTPTHFFILRYVYSGDHPFYDRTDTFSRGVHLEHNGWISNFDEAFPEFKGNKAGFYSALADLKTLGLVQSKPLQFPDPRHVEARYIQATGKMYQPTWEEASIEILLKRMDRDESAARGGMLNLWDIQATRTGGDFLRLIDEPNLTSDDEGATP